MIDAEINVQRIKKQSQFLFILWLDRLKQKVSASSKNRPNMKQNHRFSRLLNFASKRLL